jgi:hypothetical protein
MKSSDQEQMQLMFAIQESKKQYEEMELQRMRVLDHLSVGVTEESNMNAFASAVRKQYGYQVEEEKFEYEAEDIASDYEFEEEEDVLSELDTPTAIREQQIAEMTELIQILESEAKEKDKNIAQLRNHILRMKMRRELVNLCELCKVSEIGFAHIPCGHVACSECRSDNTCPICTVKIKRTMQVFM